MHRYPFYLQVTAEQFLEYYRGSAKHVVVKSTTGQTVQFPASFLQKFITSTGIEGNFVLTCDANHKVISLQKV